MSKTLELRCPVCNSVYHRKESSVKHDLKRRPEKISYCSQECGWKAKIKPLTETICQHCQVGFSRRPSGKDSLKYCSKSCSALAASSSRKRVRLCSICEKNPVDRTGKCSDCKMSNLLGSRTLIELKNAYDISQYHAKIRGNARATYYKNDKDRTCQICNYSLHTDICHIKDVKDFSLSSTVNQVNAIDNLVALCKNHHWEFDNGYISL